MLKKLFYKGCDYHSYIIGDTRVIAFFFPLKSWDFRRWELKNNLDGFILASPWFKVGLFPKNRE